MLCSCNTIHHTVYRTNKKITFSSKADYLDYFRREFDIQSEKIYFPETTEYWTTIQYLLKDVDYFYGITTSESLMIDDSYLNKIKSCPGRISQIIHDIDKSYNTKPTQISSYSFKNINGQKMDITNGKSVIFIISTRLGSDRKKILKQLSSEVEALMNHSVNYYFISVDTPISYSIK